MIWLNKGKCIVITSNYSITKEDANKAIVEKYKPKTSHVFDPNSEIVLYRRAMISIPHSSKSNASTAILISKSSVTKMSENAQEYLRQFYSATPNPRLRRKRRATSEFIKGIFTRGNRTNSLQSEYNEKAAHGPLTCYSQTMLWSTQDVEGPAPKDSPHLTPVPKPWMRSTGSLAPSKPRSSATSSTTSFKSRLDLDIPSSASQSILQYSEQIKRSPFYCCSVEYARRLATTGSEGRAPLFVISESPTEPVVKPCSAPECPIAADHNEGSYLYLGEQMPQWLQDELDREFTAGARHIFGHSNPHPLIWIAFWRSILNIASKEERNMVKNFMECHGLLGNRPVDAEQSRAYELCRTLNFDALSPASSTSSPN